MVLSFPETYRRLLKSGISEDYSLGYSSTPGFRWTYLIAKYVVEPFYKDPHEIKAEEPPSPDEAIPAPGGQTPVPPGAAGGDAPGGGS